MVIIVPTIIVGIIIITVIIFFYLRHIKKLASKDDIKNDEMELSKTFDIDKE